MTNRSKIPKYESEVSGFFPQLPREPGQPTDPREYYNWLRTRIGQGGSALPECPEGTDPIKMLMERFPRGHGIHTLGICNVFAHMPDRRTIPALLAKWREAPAHGPGDRYIPDALAAIGDRSVVPALVARRKELTIDYRIHIAHAMGIFGGELAERTLKDMAANDPNISVRGEATRALTALKQRRPSGGD
jgi:hypothetical protein